MRTETVRIQLNNFKLLTDFLFSDYEHALSCILRLSGSVNKSFLKRRHEHLFLNERVHELFGHLFMPVFCIHRLFCLSVQLYYLRSYVSAPPGIQTKDIPEVT